MSEKTGDGKGAWSPMLSREFLVLCWAVFFIAFYLIVMLYGGCCQTSDEWRLADEMSPIIPTQQEGETDV